MPRGPGQCRKRDQRDTRSQSPPPLSKSSSSLAYFDGPEKAAPLANVLTRGWCRHNRGIVVLAQIQPRHRRRGRSILSRPFPRVLSGLTSYPNTKEGSDADSVGWRPCVASKSTNREHFGFALTAGRVWTARPLKVLKERGECQGRNEGCSGAVRELPVSRSARCRRDLASRPRVTATMWEVIVVGRWGGRAAGG